MKVAKVVIEAPVVSFRYPHFLIGRQIIYDMPPPSTIYGHIASAVGEWFDPGTVRFAYQFTFQSKGSDLEYQHIIAKPPGTRGSTFETLEEKYPVAVAGTIQPHFRDFLYDCTLILYLDPPDFAEAFRNPVFCVNLGRSQDLARIARVEEVELRQAEGAYLEKTLLPFSMRKYLGRGVTVLMPRYIDPPPEREPVFARYIILHERVFAGKVPDYLPHLLEYDGEAPRRWWIDPASPSREGFHLGLIFHSFLAGEGDV